MRCVACACLSSALFVSTLFAQLNLTIYADPNSPDSAIIRWQTPSGATSPVTYLIMSGPTLGNYSFLTALTDSTEYHYPIPAFNRFQRFFQITAADSADTYYSNHCALQAFITVGGSGLISTPFGIPFMTWDVVRGVPQYGVPSTDPSDIIGEQTPCAPLAVADRVLRQDNGEFALRNQNAGCAWTQLLEVNHNLRAPRAFWYQNRTGANRRIIIFGEADVTTASAPVTIIDSQNDLTSTPYSWRDPRPVDRYNLQLLEQGFHGGTIGTSDRVLSQVGGSFFYHRVSDHTWQGVLLQVLPGEAYWIQSFGHEAYTYIYNP